MLPALPSGCVRQAGGGKSSSAGLPAVAGLPGRQAAEDAGVMLAQPSKHQFAHGSERALRQSAEFDRFGSIKRRFLAHFVADPYTQHADRGPLRNRRDQRSYVKYSGNQTLGVVEPKENSDRPLGFQRDAGLGAAKYLGHTDNFIAGEEFGLLESKAPFDQFAGLLGTFLIGRSCRSSPQKRGVRRG